MLLLIPSKDRRLGWCSKSGEGILNRTEENVWIDTRRWAEVASKNEELGVPGRSFLQKPAKAEANKIWTGFPHKRRPVALFNSSSLIIQLPPSSPQYPSGPRRNAIRISIIPHINKPFRSNARSTPAQRTC